LYSCGFAQCAQSRFCWSGQIRAGARFWLLALWLFLLGVAGTHRSPGYAVQSAARQPATRTRVEKAVPARFLLKPPAERSERSSHAIHPLVATRRTHSHHHFACLVLALTHSAIDHRPKKRKGE